MMLPRQFATTIFSATQRSNIGCYIVSTGCNTVPELQRRLCCAKIIVANRPVYNQRREGLVSIRLVVLLI